MGRGGYRPGSGRPKGAKNRGQGEPKSKREKKPREVVPADIEAEAAAANMTPLDYMLMIMRSRKAHPNRRDRMAIAAAPFVHARPGESKGKKGEREEAAKKAGSGKFAPAPAPLKAIQGGK